MQMQSIAKHRSGARLFAALVGLVLLGGCARQPVMLPPRLAVLPLTLQVRQINRVAARIHSLRLTGSLTIHYYNRRNQLNSVSLHAVLLIQRLTSAGASAASSSRQAEVLLLTTYLGQNAMELGVNRSGYWLINHEKNIAYIGALDSRGQTPPGVLPLNPARLLGLLGFAALPTDGRTVQTIVPGAAHLQLLVLGYRHGRLMVSRKIAVSRYTGRITRVTLFNADSRAVAICDLARYPVIAPSAVDSPATPVSKLIGRRFIITVPARRIRIQFQVHHVYTRLPGKARFIFQRPSLRGDKVGIIRPSGITQ